MTQSAFQFSHHKLEAYRVARQVAVAAKQVADEVPRGYRPWAEQLIRAAGSTVALIGEGANRYSAAQKRQRFTEARGEAGEVACWVELLDDLGMVAEGRARPLLRQCDRLCGMLTGLIKRWR